MSTKKHILAFGSVAEIALNDFQRAAPSKSAHMQDTVFTVVDLKAGVDLSQHKLGDAYMLVMSKDDLAANKAVRAVKRKFKAGSLNSMATPWFIVTVGSQDGLMAGQSGPEKILSELDTLHAAWMKRKQEIAEADSTWPARAEQFPQTILATPASVNSDFEGDVLSATLPVSSILAAEYAQAPERTMTPSTNGKVAFINVGLFAQEMVKSAIFDNPQWDVGRFKPMTILFEGKDTIEQVKHWLSQLITIDRIRPEDQCILVYEEDMVGRKEIEYTRELISRITSGSYGEVCFPHNSATITERQKAADNLTEQAGAAFEAIGAIKPQQESPMKQKQKKEEFAPIQIIVCTSPDAFDIACKIFDGLSHADGLRPRIFGAYDSKSFKETGLLALRHLRQEYDHKTIRPGNVFDVFVIANNSNTAWDFKLGEILSKEFPRSLNFLGYKIFSLDDRVVERQAKIEEIGEELRARQRRFAATVEVAPVPSHGYRDFTPPATEPKTVSEEEASQSKASLSEILQERNPLPREKLGVTGVDNDQTEIDPRIVKMIQNNAQVMAEFQHNVMIQFQEMRQYIRNLESMRGASQSGGHGYGTAFGQPQLRHPAGLPSGYGPVFDKMMECGEHSSFTPNMTRPPMSMFDLPRRFGDYAASTFVPPVGMGTRISPRPPARQPRTLGTVKEIVSKVKMLLVATDIGDYYEVLPELTELAKRYPNMREQVLLLDPIGNTIPAAVINEIIERTNLPVFILTSPQSEKSSLQYASKLMNRRDHASATMLIKMHAVYNLVTGYLAE